MGKTLLPSEMKKQKKIRKKKHNLMVYKWMLNKLNITHQYQKSITYEPITKKIIIHC